MCDDGATANMDISLNGLTVNAVSAHVEIKNFYAITI